jgi:hypothetical protein
MTASARYDDGGYSSGSTARPDANVSRGRRQRGRRIHVLHSGDGGTIPPLKVCSFGRIEGTLAAAIRGGRLWQSRS